MHETESDLTSKETFSIPIAVGNEINDADGFEERIINVELHLDVFAVSDHVVKSVFRVERDVNDAHNVICSSPQSGSCGW